MLKNRKKIKNTMSLSITASLGSKVGQYMRGNSQEPKPGPIHESGTIHERPIHERALYLLSLTWTIILIITRSSMMLVLKKCGDNSDVFSVDIVSLKEVGVCVGIKKISHQFNLRREIF